MAIPFLSNIDMNKNEIQNLVLHSQTSDPTGSEGQIYYNTSTNKVLVHDGSNFISIAGDIESITSATTDQLTIANGTGPSPALTIVTAAIANGGTGLATADQIHTFVTTQTDSIAADTSGKAAKVTVTEDTSSNTNFNVVYHNGSNALLDESSTGGFTYNPSTETLSVKNLSVTVKTTQKDVEVINTSGGIIFEGDTADDNETTLDVVDPTADRTINLPNASGTVQLAGDATREKVFNAPSTAKTAGTAFTIDHNLNSRDIIIQVYNNVTNIDGNSGDEIDNQYETVNVEVYRNTVDQITIKSGVALAANSLRVLITKIG